MRLMPTGAHVIVNQLEDAGEAEADLHARILELLDDDLRSRRHGSH